MRGVVLALAPIVFISIVEYHQAHCSVPRSEVQDVMLALEFVVSI
jgi:hypothetical protein